MLTRKALIERYKTLARHEKEVIGEALVKVNLGVAMPADQKRVAAFLKGSEFIAKADTLDKLIAFLHADPNESGPLPDEATSLVSKEGFSTTAAEALVKHPEDTVVTSKEKLKP